MSFLRKYPMPLPGQRFGKLTVRRAVKYGYTVRRAVKYGYTWYAECVCNCGTIKEIPPSLLARGKIVSCGCAK